MEYLKQFLNLVAEQDPQLMYPILFVGAFLENLIPPIPGDTIVVFGAYLVGRGSLKLVPVCAVTCVGGTMGFLLMYYLAYTKGRALLIGRRRRLRFRRNIERAERWFIKYGDKVVLFNRFLSGVRSIIAISAGLSGMSPAKVSFYAFLSMAVWNGLLIYAGLVVGSNWEAMLRFLGVYNKVVLTALGTLLCALGIVLYLSRRRERQKAQPNRTCRKNRVA